MLNIEKPNQKNEAFYKKLFERNQEIMLLIDPETSRIIECNRAACSFYGYPDNEMTKLSVTDFNMLSQEQVANKLELAKMNLENHFNFRHRLFNGQIRDVEVHSTPIEIDGKDLLFSIISDITDTNIFSEELKAENALLERTVAERANELEETNGMLKKEIKEKKHLEDILKHELAFNHALLENIPNGVVACDENGMLTLFNRTAREWHGMDAKKIANDKWTDYYSLYNGDGTSKLNAEEIPLSRAFQGETVKNSEMVICAKNQLMRYLSTNGCSFFDDNGKKLGAVMILSDNTEQKQAEKDLLTNQSQLKDIIDFLPDATLAINKDRRVIIWNKAIEKMTGIPASEMIGKGDFAYTIPFYGKARPQLLDLLFLDDETVETQYPKITRESGSLIAEAFCPTLYDRLGAWVFAKASPLHDHFGNIIGAIESIRDITDRKQSENILKESEERFKATFEQAAVGIVHTTLGGNFIRVNQKFCDIVGYSQDELLSMSFKDITHPKDLVDDLGNMTQLLHGDISTFSMEKRYFKKDHTFIWANLTVSAINQLSGNETYIMGVVEDISERKQAEETLKSSEYTLRTLFEGASDALFLIDDHKIIDCNQAALDLFGYVSKESVMGKNPWKLSPGIQPDGMKSKKKIMEIYETALEKGMTKFEWWYKKTDNTMIVVEIVLTLIMLAGKKLFHALCRDVTDRKQMEKNLEYLGFHDQLTGLYNRRFYKAELMRLDTKRNLPMTIVMGDVNGLKLINDSFGHTTGDELLKKVAEVIQKVCRSDDIIARLGGDEFVILLPKTDASETDRIIKRINDLALKEKVSTIDISISFGYQTKNNEEEDIEDIFKKAEDEMYKKKLFESPSMRGKTIGAIISTLHEKNKREEQHSHRVSALCKSMGVALGLFDYKIEELKSVGLLHDIGKIALDENVLSKPGKLSEDEWKEIRRHPGIGYRILSTVNDMSEMAEYVLAHHERWDGKGYPKGLKGEEIPFVSRIIAIADAYDAMTSERSYRGALTNEFALEELRKNAGVQFDPKLIEVFIEKVVGNSNLIKK